MISRYSKAILDLKSLVTHARLWSYLAWMDIRQRYVGSMLGPFWISLTMVIFIGCLSLVYSRLLHQSYSEYIPFLTVGLMLWVYISSVLTDSCDMFIEGKQFIHATQLPYSLFLYRIVSRNFIVFLHNAIVFIIVAVVFRLIPNWNSLLFIPGFIMVTVNITSIAMILGLLATRYRDIPPIINSLIQVAFFISPVTWMPALIGNASHILKWNPITHYMAITRDPLLGKAVDLWSWEYMILFTTLTSAIALLTFAKTRNNIAFWL